MDRKEGTFTKSTLNPNAVPYVPLYATKPSPPLVEHQHVPEGTQETADLAAKLPDSISFDYEGGMSDEQRVVENIANMYPDIPMDFIIDFAGAHGYDFDQTVDMLDQFFVCQAESSESRNDVGPDPPNTKPGGSST